MCVCHDSCQVVWLGGGPVVLGKCVAVDAAGLSIPWRFLVVEELTVAGVGVVAGEAAPT